MFKRNIINDMIQWAEKPNRKPLVLRGARQVGKTSVVKLFSTGFKQYIYFNLEIDAHKNIFSNATNFNDLLQQIFLQSNTQIQLKKDTLIFIDEIQEVPEVFNWLRYFYENEPDIKVIAAGSLLETLFKKEISFPVGRVEYMVIRPVSFQEFLAAIGEEEALKELIKIPFENYAYDKLFQLFHQYALIGGMPEVVQNYLSERNIAGLQNIYNSLITAYEDDIEKYAKNTSAINYLRHAIQSVYAEAGKRIKFHGFGKSNYGSLEMGEALRTLEKAFLIKLMYPVTNAQLPLIPNKRKAPRLQVLDTGLLNFSVGIQSELIGTKNLEATYNGLVIEHLVGQELLTLNKFTLTALPFWVREKNTSSAEVDYLHLYKGKLIPVEVKSGEVGKLKSLHLFMDEAPHQTAIRFCAAKQSITPITTAAGKNYFLLTLPYFSVSQINNWLEWFEEEIKTFKK